MACLQNSNITSLKILYWNARSFKQRRLELSSILKNVDIFICVETWLTPSDTILKSDILSSFVIYRKDRVRAKGGGILILVRKNVAYHEISDIVTPDDSVEMCGITLNNILPLM